MCACVGVGNELKPRGILLMGGSLFGTKAVVLAMSVASKFLLGCLCVKEGYKKI